MKLDSSHVVSPGSVGHNADNKPDEYDNTAFDSTKLKSLKESDKENQNGLRSDFLGRKVDSDQLEHQVDNVGGWNESGHEHDLGKSDDSKKAVREYVGAMSPSHPYVKPQSFENSVFYVDKSVMERELPEVVIYKENTYQVVKDICIDSGGDPKSLCIILPPENPDVPIPDAFKSPVEQTDLGHCGDDTGPSQENDSQIDSSISTNDKASRPRSGDGRDDSDETGVNVSSKDNRSLRDLLSMTHWGTELSWPKYSIDDVEQSKLHFFQKSREDSLPEMDSVLSKPQSDNEEVTLGEPELVSVAKGSDHGEPGFVMQKAREDSLAEMDSVLSKPQSDNEEVTLCEPGLVSAVEGPDHGVGGVGLKVPAVNSGVSEPDHTAEELEIARQKMDTETAALASEIKELDDPVKGASHPNKSTTSSSDELACHSKIETGSDAFDLKSTSQMSNCETEEEHLEPQNASGLRIDGPDTSSSHPRYSQGETSFSDAVPFSGLITYTGPIAYSGSLSLRSDSSTTSTRSFAFPILQSEWNNSPVRMAKADRKHLSRHRRWRHGLLCCKF